MNRIEIEGKIYEKIPQQSSSNGISKKLLSMLAISASMYSDATGGSNYQRERPSVNLIEEFKLIQQKKSKLNRSDMEWVISKFKKLYKEI